MTVLIRSLIILAAFAVASPWLTNPKMPSELSLEEILKCPDIPLWMTDALRDTVSISNDTLFIKAKNGKAIELKTVISKDEPENNIIYCLKEYFPQQDILIVDYRLYEDGGFTAVNLTTGEMMHYDGLYKLSPDRKHLLHESIYQYELHFLQILKPTSCGLVQEFIHEQNNALRQTVFAWTDDQTIEMTFYPDRGETPADKRMGRIYKGPDFWKMRTTELYSKIMTDPRNP